MGEHISTNEYHSGVIATLVVSRHRTRVWYFKNGGLGGFGGGFLGGRGVFGGTLVLCLVVSQQPRCITNDGLFDLYILFFFVGVMACASISTRLKNQYEKSKLAQALQDRKKLNSYVCSLERLVRVFREGL